MKVNPLRIFRFGGFLIATAFMAWAWFDAYPSNLTPTAIIGLCGFLLIGYAASALRWGRSAAEPTPDIVPSDQDYALGAIDFILALIGIALLCLAFWKAS